MPPVADKVVDEPAQMAVAPLPVIVGNGFTVTVAFAILAQPAALVPVTVYVFVDVGFAVTLEPVVADKPGDGDQVYVTPPVAVNTVDDPLHMAIPLPALITGKGFTVTVTDAVLLQP